MTHRFLKHRKSFSERIIFFSTIEQLSENKLLKNSDSFFLILHEEFQKLAFHRIFFNNILEKIKIFLIFCFCIKLIVCFFFFL